MMDVGFISNYISRIDTPCYILNEDEFKNRSLNVRSKLNKNIGLCFSIKANPFLLYAIPDSIDCVEVCSPGELSICRNLKIRPDKIVYSGVNKDVSDISEAIAYGVNIITAESPGQVELINKCAKDMDRKVCVILRLTSGNQFGMDYSDIIDILNRSADYPYISFEGLHYYSGTQKKKPDIIKKDISTFFDSVKKIEDEVSYSFSHIEYGPGAAVDYFSNNCDEKDNELLDVFCDEIDRYADEYNITVEMGRFLAVTSGVYVTEVADIKNNSGTKYVICDGGINHINYYGQTMAMQIPPIFATSTGERMQNYTLCGSLCTTADILVRKICLPELSVGDRLVFGRCGAYSVTEGISLFLSRDLPKVYMFSEKEGIHILREKTATYKLNQ